MKVYGKRHKQWVKKWNTLGAWIWRSRLILLLAIVTLPATFFAGRNMGMRTPHLILMESTETFMLVAVLYFDSYYRRRREIRESYRGIAARFQCNKCYTKLLPIYGKEECGCGTPKNVPSLYGECRNSSCSEYRRPKHLIKPVQYFSEEFLGMHPVEEKGLLAVKKLHAV